MLIGLCLSPLAPTLDAGRDVCVGLCASLVDVGCIDRRLRLREKPDEIEGHVASQFKGMDCDVTASTQRHEIGQQLGADALICRVMQVDRTIVAAQAGLW